MFYRRRLPHWHPDITEETFLFVTWRLADTLPRSQPKQLAGEIRNGRENRGACHTVSAGRAFLALDREMDKAAFGPVWLQNARVARVVAAIHQRVMLPSTTARRAPVAEGRLPGLPCHVRCARIANATASLASMPIP
jgi:hypothetical protein